MPGSPFKSRPKSDRRKEWKALKTKNEKALTKQKIKVEIGLGKELDNLQKQIDTVLALDDKSLTKKALDPVVTAATKVQASINKLRPKVTAFNDLTTFLVAVEKDIKWWNKAAGVIAVKQPPRSHWDAREVPEAIGNLTKAQPLIAKLDTLLATALTQQGAYDTPDQFKDWAKASKAIQPLLGKARVVAADPEHNLELARKLLKTNAQLIRNMENALFQMKRINLRALPEWADWNEVDKTIYALDDLISNTRITAFALK